MSFFITHSISYLGKISRYEFVKIAFFAIHKLRLRRKYGKIVSLKEGAAKTSNTTDEATPSIFKVNSFLFFFLSDFKLIQCFFQFFKIATCFFQKIKIM